MSGILTELPGQLGAALGTSSDNAALLLSVAILTFVGLSCALIGRKMNLLATAVPMMATLAFLISIAWLPFWILGVIAIMVAYMFADGIKHALTGG